MEDLNAVKITQEQWEKIDAIIQKHGSSNGNIIPLLEEIQEYLGYIPVEVQEEISKKTGISKNHIYGIVSFYSYFTMVPRGRHRIQVCLGTACYVRGGKLIAEKIEKEYGLKPGECTKDGRFTYETARCFGACGLAPVMVVDGDIYSKVEVPMVDEILKKYK